MKILFAGPDSDLVMTNSGADRKEGVHLSDILSRMAYERDKKYNPEAPKDLMVFECGFTWETVVARALGERQVRVGYRPEQLQEDGVWLSPDWLNPDADVQHEEWKATKKSLNNYEQKIDEWGPQAKSYLRALRKRKLVKKYVTRFRVWFMVGDWSFESKGDLTLLRDYWRIDVEYSERDVEEEWAAVVSSGKRYGLLKEAKAWEDRPRLQRTLARRLSRSSKGPAKSRGKAPIVTFPSSRNRSRSSSDS